MTDTKRRQIADFLDLMFRVAIGRDHYAVFEKAVRDSGLPEKIQAAIIRMRQKKGHGQ